MDKKGSFFTVTVRRQEVVAAALPLQEHRLPLSNLDLLLPPLDVGVFFCYGGAGRTPHGCTAAETLKGSLARVLVPYYPFAGEMVSNAAGEPEILCNNRGVDFIEAQADVELADLRLHEPDDGVGRLVPNKKNGVLCIQATELKCGGLVVGCSFDHRVADAYSANMFFVSWAEAARWLPPSCGAPSFKRSLLGPRRPGYHDDSIDDLFVPLSSLPPPPKAGLAVSCVSRIYSISADDISRLQALASATTPGGYGRTKIEAFTAYLWQVLGGAQSAQSCTCSLGVVVNGRSRMRGSLGAYFGNVISVPYATLEAEELRSMELRAVADEVHEFIAQAATREHFLGLIDWVEAHRPAPAMSRLFTVGGGAGDGERTAVLVSSGRGFPVQDVDFGWGRPAFGSYYCPWSGGTGYVMPIPGAGGDGDWLVYVHLSETMVKALETAAGEVFRPVASACSELTIANC